MYYTTLQLYVCFVLSGDRKPSKVPRFVLPEDFFVNIATAIYAEVNHGLRFLEDVSCGGNLKQFLLVCLLLCLLALLLLLSFIFQIHA